MHTINATMNTREEGVDALPHQAPHSLHLICLHLFDFIFLIYLSLLPLQRANWCPSNITSPEMFEEDLPTQHLASLDLQSDYRVQFTMDGNATTILIEPANEMIKNFRSFKLSCPSADVSE